MDPIPPMPEPQAVPPQTPAMPLTAKLFNVVAAPGEVFAELSPVPVRVINWLVPVLIFAVVGVITVCILFAQPAIRQGIHDQQVQQGKMTQAQEDQALQAIDRFMGPMMLTVFGSVGAVLNSFISVFWWALVLWLCGRWFLKARFNYMKAVEIAGLASVIIVLGMVI